MQERGIIVIGCGKTGHSFCKKFADRRLFLFDDKIENARKLAENFPNSQPFSDISEIAQLNIEFALISPGIRTKFNPHAIISALKAKNIPIFSDFDIMSQNIDKKTKILGITGTNGKSTTTAMMAFVLQKLGKNAIACGNIGNAVLECDFTGVDYVCLEASSYQLEVSNISFYAGILLNLSQDHLDHHGTMQAYLAEKTKVFTNLAIASVDDEYCKSAIKNDYITFSCKEALKSGFSFYENGFYLNKKKLDCDINRLSLKGIHNMQNILAVMSFCHKEGFEISEIWDAICDFKTLRHRMQEVRKIGNITFINDSKATNPDSVKYALSCLDEVYLIAGGVSKYPHAIKEIEEFYPKIKAFFLIGQAAAEFSDDICENKLKFISQTMEKAISDAYKCVIQDIKNHKVKNPIILLSPLCASFDQYKNFEERGDDFVNLVEKL
ncbi:UDP-N-acetylmuramoyl-L-alanine--D-glutamate ligase [Candidatus Deianiraea vastatrix]|uniref:UDP-N-acetylmuramoylalanine--D-glutamate ligase n=1 Tax=Candidatus Deianiraea vastatrix TaxID=2163644 RepID=A0A5B8XE10_9RICK|nr:UDP-N-acetylmuramoyl-L-alanine--D-glutamate ligase [Candidatus Deianiraea vastatrix]QED23579.1 UDP-N-acetylmuramoylalanine--D-glutamate ligase [Candidatus Deianiraea vastatrix]